MEHRNNLTQGNIVKSLVRFALPVLFAMFLQSLYGGVDLLVVGQFATTADVSGVGTGSMLMQTVTMVITGLAMGVTILVAQKVGEGDGKQVGRVIGAAICLFAVLGVVLTIVLGGFSGPLARLLHAPEEAFLETRSYIRVCGLGCVFIVAYNVLGAIFRGIGDSRTPLITVCIACGLNIVCDLLFVAVFHMGAMGAALATVLSQTVSVAVSLGIILKKALPFYISRSMVRFDGSIIKTELKLGAPLALQELLVGVSFLTIQAIVNSFDVISSAGIGVAEKVCGFIMLVPGSFLQSMAAFVGQNIGAGERLRAKQALKSGIIISLIAGAVMFAFTFLKGDLLAGIFAKGEDVIAAAHSYLKAYAVDCLFVAVMFSFVGYFNGCGKTMFAMVSSIIGAVGVRIPAAFLISSMEGASLFHIGLSTPAATVVQIILCLWYYWWLKKKKDPVIL